MFLKHLDPLLEGLKQDRMKHEGESGLELIWHAWAEELNPTL